MCCVLVITVWGRPAGSDSQRQRCDTIVLAVRLHYPRILKLLHQSTKDLLLTATGKSTLMEAMSGGSLFGGTIGRFIRHGPEFVGRATKTLAYLLENGASDHLKGLPGTPCCTAVFYASQTQKAGLYFILRNGGKEDIDTPSTRSDDLYEDMRPPLFEAVVYGKTQNIECLLEHSANVCTPQNQKIPTTILYQCAESGYQELSIIDRFLAGGVGIDDRPEEYETPFVCAVRNRCFNLAEYLLSKGANPNAMATKGLMFSASEPITLLGALVSENSQSSIACVRFLLRERPGSERVNLIVRPSGNRTVFHQLASLDGDQQDPEATRVILEVCGEYFEPTSNDLNALSKSTHMADSVECAGGNTALHLAVIHGNYEVVQWLLVMNEGMDGTIRNSSGFTVKELAILQYTDFEKRFCFRDIPEHHSKQLNKARRRREGIMRLLEKYVAGEPRDVLAKYTLDASEE